MAQQLINVLLNILAYSDGSSSTRPDLKDVDYNRQLVGIPTGNSFSRRFRIPAGEVLDVVNNTRSISQDATTVYTVERVKGNTYRYRHTSGTAPAFRTHRVTSEDATTEITVTKSGDVVRYDHTGGTAPDFSGSGVVVGDHLLIEEDGPFNSLNEGTFVIVSVGSDFVEVLNSSGVAEGPITLGADIDGTLPPLDVFSASGVQVGDQARVTSTAFNIENRGIFTVSAVSHFYFEVENGNPGIPETSITLGSADGITFYPDIFKWLYIEADQKVSVRVNGDSSDNFELEPPVAGDAQNIAPYLQRGGVYSLSIANNGLEAAEVKVFLAE